MSDLPPPLPEKEEEPVESRGPAGASGAAWTVGGSIAGAIGLVTPALASRAFKEYWGSAAPAVMVGLTIIALVGAVAGALTGALVSGFRRKRSMKSHLNNPKNDLPSPLPEIGEKPVRQGWSIMAILNTGTALGGRAGAVSGLFYFGSLMGSNNGEFSILLGLLLPSLLIGLLGLVVIGAVAGALIGALYCIFRRHR